MDSRQQLQQVWDARLWLLLIGVIAAAVAYGGSHLLPKTYRSDSLVQVIPRQQTVGNVLTTDQLLQTTNFYLEVARTTAVIERARRAVGTTEGKMEAYAQPDVLVLGFGGESRDPRRAADYANAYARAFASTISALQESERQQANAEPQRRVAEIQQRLERVPGDSAEGIALNTELQALQARLAENALAPVDRVRILQPALVPAVPAKPRPLRNGVLAFIAALVLGTSALILRNFLGDRYSGIEEAALDLRAPVLGEVPRARPTDPASLEAFRKLRAQTEHALAGTPGSPKAAPSLVGSRGASNGHGAVRSRTLLVTGAEANMGKSYVTANLARALAIDGRHVVVVDGDLRRPAVAQMLGVPDGPGLADLLSVERPSDIEAAIAEVPLPARASHRGGVLEVLRAGPPSAENVERLSSDQMAEVMHFASGRADVVVVDSPPVLAVVDAVILSRYADAVVLVLDVRRSKRKTMRRAAQTLRAVDAPLTGLISNRARVSEVEQGYYGPAPEASREPQLIR